MEYAIATFVTWALLSLLLVYSRKPALYDNKEKALILRYSPAFAVVMIIVCSVLPIGLFTAILLSAGIKSESDFIAYPATFLAFFTLGTYMYLRFTRERLFIFSDAIAAQYPISRPRLMRWEEISRVTYSPTAKWLVLETPDARRIRVNKMMTGFNQFCQYASTKMPSVVYGDELSRAINDAFAP